MNCDRRRAPLACLVFASVALLLAAFARVTPVNPAGAPPGLPARPVEETYFGTVVVDRFRFIESKDPATLAWMRAQSAWTRAVFDAIPPRADYLRKLSEFGSSFAFVRTVQTGGARVFYLERKAGADVWDLVVKEGSGEARTLVDTAALIKAAGGVPQAIDYYQTSPDGARVAVGISPGGSEASKLTVIDVASGRTVAGPIDRAQFATPSWLDDGSGVFFLRLQELQPGAAPTEKYRNSAVWFWTLTDEPVAIVGASTGLGPITDPDKFPAVAVIARSGQAFLFGINGVQNEFEAWTAPVAQARTGRVH